MVKFLSSLLISIVFAFLAGLGTGAGSLLLLWLTQVIKLPQEQARIINLLFFLPASLIATLFRKKQQTIPGKPAVSGIIAGCSGALLFSLLGRRIDVSLLQKLLGGLLILTGLREIFYRPRNAR